jgi:hypothetical protein
MPSTCLPSAALSSAVHARHELRFPSRALRQTCFAFPCDGAGQVCLDTLGEHARADYFYARALVGIDLLRPVVCRVE